MTDVLCGRCGLPRGGRHAAFLVAAHTIAGTFGLTLGYALAAGVSR